MRLQTRWARVDFDSTRRQRVCSFPGPPSTAYSGNRRTESEMHPWNAHRAWVVLLSAATARAVTASLATAAPGAAPRIVHVRAVWAAGNERPGQEVRWSTARGVFIATIDRLKSTMSVFACVLALIAARAGNREHADRLLADLAGGRLSGISFGKELVLCAPLVA